MRFMLILYHPGSLTKVMRIELGGLYIETAPGRLKRKCAEKHYTGQR